MIRFFCRKFLTANLVSIHISSGYGCTVTTFLFQDFHYLADDNLKSMIMKYCYWIVFFTVSLIACQNSSKDTTFLKNVTGDYLGQLIITSSFAMTTDNGQLLLTWGIK